MDVAVLSGMFRFKCLENFRTSLHRLDLSLLSLGARDGGAVRGSFAGLSAVSQGGW